MKWLKSIAPRSLHPVSLPVVGDQGTWPSQGRTHTAACVRLPDMRNSWPRNHLWARHPLRALPSTHAAPVCRSKIVRKCRGSTPTKFTETTTVSLCHIYIYDCCRCKFEMKNRSDGRSIASEDALGLEKCVESRPAPRPTGRNPPTALRAASTRPFPRVQASRLVAAVRLTRGCPR